jgi:tRNA pseudouridine65 synthase
VNPVHRLDAAASGVLLLAFDADTTRELQAAMTASTACKRYLALVRGVLAEGTVTVTNPMKDDEDKPRDAVTVITRLAASSEPRCSLALAEPRTGRFHQVRRHLRDLDHPIIGDSKHGDTRVNATFRACGATRLQLHAWRLDLPDAKIAVRCPLAPDLRAVWSTLPWWGEVCGMLGA